MACPPHYRRERLLVYVQNNPAVAAGVFGPIGGVLGGPLGALVAIVVGTSPPVTEVFALGVLVGVITGGVAAIFALPREKRHLRRAEGLRQRLTSDEA